MGLGAAKVGLKKIMVNSPGKSELRIMASVCMYGYTTVVLVKRDLLSQL